MLRLIVNGVHADINDDLQKYAQRKLGKLDKYIPKEARESAHAEVFLKENKIKNKKNCTCEVIVHLPHGEIATEETTMNIFAAIDIVEAKIKNQLKKYKSRHSSKGKFGIFLKHHKGSRG